MMGGKVKLRCQKVKISISNYTFQKYSPTNSIFAVNIVLNVQLNRYILKLQCKIHSIVRLIYIYLDILLIALFKP